MNHSNRPDPQEPEIAFEGSFSELLRQQRRERRLSIASAIFGVVVVLCAVAGVVCYFTGPQLVTILCGTVAILFNIFGMITGANRGKEHYFLLIVAAGCGIYCLIAQAPFFPVFFLVVCLLNALLYLGGLLLTAFARK